MRPSHPPLWHSAPAPTWPSGSKRPWRARFWKTCRPRSPTARWEFQTSLRLCQPWRSSKGGDEGRWRGWRLWKSGWCRCSGKVDLRHHGWSTRNPNPKNRLTFARLASWKKSFQFTKMCSRNFSANFFGVNIYQYNPKINKQYVPSLAFLSRAFKSSQRGQLWTGCSSKLSTKMRRCGWSLKRIYIYIYIHTFLKWFAAHICIAIYYIYYMYVYLYGYVL